MIEPAIWQSESMGRLTIRQRLMFIGMFSNADDQGRLRASAPVIRSTIFPYDDITLADIEIDMLQIESVSCIMLYEVNGSRFAQVINWWKYQKHQWAYPSLIPKPDGWMDRLRYRQQNKVITENWKPEEFTQEPSIDKNRIEVRKRLGKDLGKESPKGDAAKPPKTPAKVDKTALLISDVSMHLRESLDKVYESSGRKAPQHFKNELQRDAYSAALLSLDGESEKLIDKGLSRERTSLSDLLAWLETCAKNRNGNGTAARVVNALEARGMLGAIARAQKEPGYGDE